MKDWPQFLTERFGRERALAGSWALHTPDADRVVWDGFVLAPFAPWLRARVALASVVAAHLEVREWRCGVPALTLFEHATVGGSVNGDLIEAMRSAPSIGTGDEVRVDFDGRVLRAQAEHGSKTALAPEVLAYQARAGRPRDRALRDLVRALLADDAQRDDLEREDLAGLTPEIIAEHWETVEVERRAGRLVRVNVRPARARTGALRSFARRLFGGR